MYTCVGVCMPTHTFARVHMNIILDKLHAVVSQGCEQDI